DRRPAVDPLRPSRGSPTYAVRAPLVAWLAEEAARAGRDLGRVRVLDVGSGVKPYLPLFEPYASEYVAVDSIDPHADLLGTVESLPVPDASFEVVLCTQVLEHCADPAQAVRELRRVTAPRGRVLASTHGVQVYHPAPDDLWRWTHAGLERLFAGNADWSSLSVRPGSGTTACLGMLATHYIDLLAARIGLRRPARALVAGINAAAEAIDRRSAGLREPVPGTLFANYHVVAEVSVGGGNL
ncbi:MAG: class I SAM-dependent methyltransferase, partial [Gaiellaceae bacterium]